MGFTLVVQQQAASSRSRPLPAQRRPSRLHFQASRGTDEGILPIRAAVRAEGLTEVSAVARPLPASAPRGAPARRPAPPAFPGAGRYISEPGKVSRPGRKVDRPCVAAALSLLGVPAERDLGLHW